MKKFLTEKWFIMAVAAIAIALIANMALTIRNNFIIQQANGLINETEKVKQLTEEILTGTMHGLDLGVRGFALTKDEGMLNPYEKSLQSTSKTFRDLESILKKQGYPDISGVKTVEDEVNAYIEYSKEMVDIARMDSMSIFNDMLKK